MSRFTVLHVCIGNICRSPMAERLLLVAVAGAAGADLARARELVESHSVGTGGWHAGEEMDPRAARQVRARGGDPGGFRARALGAAHLDGADLVLAATVDQQDHVAALRPDARARTFVLGELDRLRRQLDGRPLPPPEPTPEGVHRRGVALVAALDAARTGAPVPPEKELADPWGRGEKAFARVAGEIEAVLRPLATTLVSPTQS